jgi:hypothetical protein
VTPRLPAPVDDQAVLRDHVQPGEQALAHERWDGPRARVPDVQAAAAAEDVAATLRQ